MEFTYDDLLGKVSYTGNYHTDLLKVLSYLDPDQSSLYSNWALVPDDRGQKEITNCVCGHAIENKFKAYHCQTKACIVVGSECIGKFGNDSRIKVNRLVRQLRNPAGTFCDICMKKATNSIEHLGKHYHNSCMERSGVPRCSTCSKFYDCACTKVKCRDCPTIIINKPIWSIRCYPCYTRNSI